MLNKKMVLFLLGVILLSGAFFFTNGVRTASAAAVSQKTVSVSLKGSASGSVLFPRSCPPTLSEGARGFWVSIVQAVMVHEGIRDWAGKLLAIDGSYGPRTAYVVSVYQIIHGLHGDGIVGPKTWHVIGIC